MSKPVTPRRRSKGYKAHLGTLLELGLWIAGLAALSLWAGAWGHERLLAERDLARFEALEGEREAARSWASSPTPVLARQPARDPVRGADAIFSPR